MVTCPFPSLNADEVEHLMETGHGPSGMLAHVFAYFFIFLIETQALSPCVGTVGGWGGQDPSTLRYFKHPGIPDGS